MGRGLRLDLDSLEVLERLAHHPDHAVEIPPAADRFGDLGHVIDPALEHVRGDPPEPFSDHRGPVGAPGLDDVHRGVEALEEAGDLAVDLVDRRVLLPAEHPRMLDPVATDDRVHDDRPADRHAGRQEALDEHVRVFGHGG
jgi:hypothetical protein